MGAVQVFISKDEFTPFMKKFAKDMPIALQKSIRDVAFRAQGNLRREISRQNLKATGNLWNKIEARPMSKFRYNVFIPKYGFQLDSMQPHWVALKRGRNITQWAMTAPNSPWRGSKPRQLPGAIFVKPHPWIQDPLTLTTKQTSNIVEKNLRQVMKK